MVHVAILISEKVDFEEYFKVHEGHYILIKKIEINKWDLIRLKAFAQQKKKKKKKKKKKTNQKYNPQNGRKYLQMK